MNVEDRLALATTVVEAVCEAEDNGGLPNSVEEELGAYRRRSADSDVEDDLYLAEGVVNAVMGAEDSGWKNGRVVKALSAYRKAASDDSGRTRSKEQRA